MYEGNYDGITLNHDVVVDLDQIEKWIFKYKGKEYKFNIESFLKLMQEAMK